MACFQVFYRVTDHSASLDSTYFFANPASTPYPVLPKGRTIQRQLDTSLVRHWRTICATKHSSCSNIPGRSIDTKIRLVDTSRRCLVDGSTHLCYAALSYVWGQGTGLSHVLQPENYEPYYELGSLQNLPQTLEDAIVLAAEIGYQYLFVDALCILQSDPKDTSLYIKMMDVIYGMADVTIVNASGHSVNDSLPGSRMGPRKISPTLAILDMCLLKADLAIGRGKTATKGLTWSNRAWTFQEQYLSRRLLILTEKRAIWECGGADWYEDMMEEAQHEWDEHGKWRDGLTVNRTSAHRIPAASQSNTDQKPIQGLFYRLVEEYSERELTFDSDALNAFQGILRALAYSTPNQCFFWALPTSTLCISLLWEPSRGDNTLRRRASDTFPSWSWVAWSGGIRYPQYLRHSRTDYNNKEFEEEPDDIIPAVPVFYRAAMAGSEALVAPDVALPTSLATLPILGMSGTTEDQSGQLLTEAFGCQNACSGILIFDTLSSDCTLGYDNRMLLTHFESRATFPVQWRHKPADVYRGERIKILLMATYTSLQQYVRLASRKETISCLAVVYRDGISYRIGMCTIDAAVGRSSFFVPRVVALG